MKKLLLSIVAALLIFSGCNKANQFKIKLNLANSDDETVVLIKSLDGKKPIILDTVVMADNKSVFTVENDDPQAIYIVVFKEKRDQMLLFPDNQDVTVKGDMDDFFHIEATGGDVMNAYNDYQQHLAQYLMEFVPLEAAANEAFDNNDSLRYEEVNAQMLAIWDEYHNYQFEYIKNHPDSYVTHYILDDLKTDIELAKVIEFEENLTGESVYRDNIKKFIESNTRVELGQPFMDFTLQTIDGKDVNLAETIKNNKVTMIDFWASWCGPCRHENPVVKAAYEKYHDKGFEVIGISVDKNEAAWLQAVEEDALPYIQVRDVEHNVSNDYAVIYIPSNFLFDQNGIMVAKGLRGEELEAKLAELLK
ncbi:MAG: AhpC/TSA family protein [Bacteroidales bacterium]|nr:AhpC/TSA family protein [Bacteroidales bacterium]